MLEERSGFEPELGGALRDALDRTGFEPELGGELRQKGVYVDEITCIGCKHCAHVAPSTFFIQPYQHDLLVSSIDWSPRTNKIVSCSHDRNAFVWVFDDESQVWKPTLVILRIDRAATDVKWSLDGGRFAVASSAKMVPVCMYESGNDWYVL